MKKTELAWSAGFLDGEGTFGVYRKQGRKPYLYIQAGQIDRQVLDRLRESLGLGKVYGPYQSKSVKSQPYFYFRLTGTDKSIQAFDKVQEWLSPVKVQQFQTSLLEIQQFS